MIFITGGIQTLLGCTQGLVSSLPDYPPSSPRGIPQPIHTGAVPLQCGQPGPGDWCNTCQLNALTRWLSTHTSSPLSALHVLPSMPSALSECGVTPDDCPHDLDMLDGLSLDEDGGTFLAAWWLA